MKRNIILVMSVLSTAFFACQKHIGPEYYFSAPGIGQSGDDSAIINTNRDVADILQRVYRNDSAYRETLAAIYSGYYQDERVLLRDLLFPEHSPVYATQKFLQMRTGTGIFRREFNRALEDGNYPVVRSSLARESVTQMQKMTAMTADEQVIAGTSPQVLTGSSAVAIYFPYSANFASGAVSAVRPATIVAADREANSAPGMQPAACRTDGPATCYQPVTVDDRYADLTPTHIVTNGATTTPTVTPHPMPAVVTRVFVGWAKLTRQMDAFISFTGNGGGSEIKIARLSGYLKKESEQVTSFDGDLITLQFTREQIMHQQWKKIMSAWDPNWVADNKQQVFAVYEDDTKGTKTFSGSLSTTVGLPNLGSDKSTNKATGDISYKVEVSTQDEIITQRKLDRSTFFSLGRTNAGWAFVGDQPGDDPFAGRWPIYDGGTIWMYSMPWQLH